MGGKKNFSVGRQLVERRREAEPGTANLLIGIPSMAKPQN